MEFEQTSIEFYGILIQEPVTAVTDLLVSTVCFYSFFKLKSTRHSVTLLRLYFLFVALSTLYGGLIGHAFLHQFTFAWKMPGWFLGMISVALLERTSITHAKPLLSGKVGQFFSVLNIIELLTLIVVVSVTLKFFYVEAHAAYGMLIVVFSFEAFIFKLTKAKSSKLFLIAVGVSALAATTHLAQFSLSRWFNYLDLSHVLMAIAAYLFFLGGIEIQQETFISNRTTDFKNEVDFKSNGSQQQYTVMKK